MGLTRIFRAYDVPLEGKAFKELLHIDTYDTSPYIGLGIESIEEDGSVGVQDRRWSPTQRMRSEMLRQDHLSQSPMMQPRQSDLSQLHLLQFLQILR